MATLEELLVERRIERVRADVRAARRMLTAAARHVESARAIAARDLEGAYALAYDATRKAIVAHMEANGLRVTSRPGAHHATIDYARQTLAGEIEARVLDSLDRMRSTRNDMEYAARTIGAQELGHDLELAHALVQAVARVLFPPEARPE